MSKIELKGLDKISKDELQALKVKLSRKEEGLDNRRGLTISTEEVRQQFEVAKQWQEICVADTKVTSTCHHYHYNIAKSISGHVKKTGRATVKQWQKLVDSVIALMEIPDESCYHRCHTRSFKGAYRA